MLTPVRLPVQEYRRSKDDWSDEEAMERREAERAALADGTVTCFAWQSTIPAAEAVQSQQSFFLGPSRSVSLPSEAVGWVVSAYETLRAFSWQLRLSPFPLASLAAALASGLPSTLLDEAHVCVLRGLAADETSRERAQHSLELALLDAMTWPQFAWEWLRLTGHPAQRHAWGPRVAMEGAEDKKGSVVDAENGAVQHDKSPSTPPNLPAPASKPWQALPFGPAAIRALLSAGATRAPAPAAALRERDYYGLPAQAKAEMLSALCDGLLDRVTFRAEIDRRENAGECATGRGGAGSAYASQAGEARAKRGQGRGVSGGQGCVGLPAPPGPPPPTNGSAPEDHNTDTCVLCGLGGSLLCCDACPAAFHMRCLGESPRSLGQGEWRCPECTLGGRGEAAGLRLPLAARDPHGRLVFLAQGAALLLERPAYEGRGASCADVSWRGSLQGDSGIAAGEPGEAAAAREAHRPRRAAVFEGEDALTLLRECRRVPRGEDAPHFSAWPEGLGVEEEEEEEEEDEEGEGEGGEEAEEGDSDHSSDRPSDPSSDRPSEHPPSPRQKRASAPPPPVPAPSLPPAPSPLDAPVAPDAYVNRYRNGWAAGVAAVRAAMEEARRRKQRGGLWLPTGTCRSVPLEHSVVPLPLSRFSWSLLQGRGWARQTQRCGRCRTCLLPTLRKGCTSPVPRVAPEDGGRGEGASEASQAASEASKLEFLIALCIKLERELWALAEGPWEATSYGLPPSPASPGRVAQTATAAHREQWAQAVRACTSLDQLRALVLQFVSHLRPCVFGGRWVADLGLWAGAEIAYDPPNAAEPAEQPSERHSRAGSASGGPSRSASAGDLLGARPGDAASSHLPSASTSHAPSHAPAHPPALGDPYEVGPELRAADRLANKVDRSGWEAGRRTGRDGVWSLGPGGVWTLHSQAPAALPVRARRAGARRGGRQPLMGLCWRRGRGRIPLRLRWLAAVEAAGTAADLALRLRQLHAALLWDAAAPPRRGEQAPPEWEEARLLGRRALPVSQTEDERRFEYLVSWGLEGAEEAKDAGGGEEDVVGNGVENGSSAEAAAAAPRSTMLEAAAAAPRSTMLEAAHPASNGHGSHPPAAALCGVGRPNGHANGAESEKEEGGAPSLRQPSPPLKMELEVDHASEEEKGEVLIEAAHPPACKSESQEASDSPPPAASSESCPLGGAHGTGPRIRRCMRCAACLNPASKKACQVLAEERAARRAEAQALEAVVQRRPLAVPDDAEGAARAVAGAAVAAALAGALGGAAGEEGGLGAAVKLRPRDHAGEQGRAGPAGPAAPGLDDGSGGVDLGALRSAGAPVWLHETLLPLWMVRAYEVRARQGEEEPEEEPEEGEEKEAEEALKPAAEEEAGEPGAGRGRGRARREGGSSVADDTGTRRRGGRRKAQDAQEADAEANAVCAECGDGEGDEAWVCCDGCELWSHASCVGLDAAAVQALEGGGQWHCPACLRRFKAAARREGGRGRGRGGAGEEAVAEERRLPALPCQPGAPGWQQRLLALLDRVSGFKCARPFLEAVPLELEDYHELISRPMDLDLLTGLVRAGTYPTLLEATLDLELVWGNCYQYNDPRAPVVADCTALKAAVEKLWAQLDVPGVRRGGGACESNENWRTLADEVLRSLLHFPPARPFWRPVDDGEAEAYSRVVAKPMDLGQVLDRLGREGYPTPENLLADAALVWSNAQLYHGRAHPVSRDAAAARDEFARLWTAAGLPLDSKKRAWGGGAHDDGRWQRMKAR